MQQWLDFLGTQHSQPLQSQQHLCALPDLGLLYVGGDDAAEFLQGQLSNDIHAIDAQTSQLSSASISKGRMFGIFRVLRIEGGYILIMPRQILAEVHQRLHRYILRAQVVMADISNDFARFAVSTVAPELLDPSIRPAEVNQVTQSDSLICLRLHGFANNHRFLLLGNDSDEAIGLWRSLGEQLTVNDQDAWMYDEICSGVPSIFPQTIEAFVPQMANLDRLDGINFKKGCYPGQEIVARTRYLGKLKRRMFLASVTSDRCPDPGDELTADPDGKPDGSGKVVMAAQGADGHCRLLFVALIDKAQANSLRLATNPTERLELQALPYAIDDEA